MEGFGDTQTHDVNLYSVGRNGKLSDLVKVSITPLTPPVIAVEINMEPAFGGLRLFLSNNPSKAALTVILLADTANNGIWEHLHTFYTMSDQITFTQRDMQAKEQKIGVVIKDRWNNKSDTVYGFITPYEEIKLDKTSWTNAKLPTDSWAHYSNDATYLIEHLWQGPDAPCSGNTGLSFASSASSPIPQHFTISLGYKASIVRMRLWPRLIYELYMSTYPREIELWGSDDPPEDGSWDNWHLLGKWEVFKPSGYGDGRDVGPITEEDTEYFNNNQEYELTFTDEISDPYRAVSFIRFKTVSTFASYGTSVNQGFIVIAEMSLWGKLQND
jgi:hypothetical protein